jgi:hypothetical protein
MTIVTLDEPRGSSDEARFELRCSWCGYGVVVRMAPDACPMCRGSVWEHAGVRRVDAPVQWFEVEFELASPPSRFQRSST